MPVLQSALDATGYSAAQIETLFWIFTATAGVVWILVMIALVLAMRRRSEAIATPPIAAEPGIERRASIIVNGLVIGTSVILLALTLASFLTSRSLASLARDQPLIVKITGHQWWWDIRYEDGDSNRIVTTANELHLPLGRTVKLELSSTDVIHSFWVPSIAGKMDLVPGRDNTLLVRPEHIGTYRGQCAEFCGLQHAHMALLVVVEPEADFAAWYTAELKSAAEPAAAEVRRGKQLFTAAACVMCHQIRGTAAGGRLGPDLTHLARRMTIAAGTLPMTASGLDRWIADPQAVKPGAGMPKVALTSDDRHAIVAYLESLK